MQDQTTPETPAAPAAPATAPVAPVASQPGEAAPTVQIPGVPGAVGATEVLRGLEAQRSELRDQLRRVERQRDDVVGQLRRAEQQNVGEATRAGLESRVAALDARIATLDKEIATADAAVAQAAAVPGAVTVEPPPPPINRSGPDEDVIAMGLFVMTIIAFPLVVAHSRRIWKRGAAAVTTLPAELMQRFARMEQGLDAVAIEVERISEGQRFMTRIFSQPDARRALGAQLPESDGVTDAPPRVS